MKPADPGLISALGDCRCGFGEIPGLLLGPDCEDQDPLLLKSAENGLLSSVEIPSREVPGLHLDGDREQDLVVQLSF